MKKRRKGRGMAVLLAVMLIGLLAVAGIIAFKTHEYNVGKDYYAGLRLGDEG